GEDAQVFEAASVAADPAGAGRPVRRGGAGVRAARALLAAGPAAQVAGIRRHAGGARLARHAAAGAAVAPVAAGRVVGERARRLADRRAVVADDAAFPAGIVRRAGGTRGAELVAVPAHAARAAAAASTRRDVAPAAARPGGEAADRPPGLVA